MSAICEPFLNLDRTILFAPSLLGNGKLGAAFYRAFNCPLRDRSDYFAVWTQSGKLGYWYNVKRSARRRNVIGNT